MLPPQDASGPRPAPPRKAPCEYSAIIASITMLIRPLLALDDWSGKRLALWNSPDPAKSGQRVGGGRGSTPRAWRGAPETRERRVHSLFRVAEI